MRQAIIIALNDLRVYFSEWGNLIGLVVMPVGLTLVLGTALGGGSAPPESIVMDVVDNDQSAESAQFLETLQAVNETLIFCPQAEENEEINCALDGNNEMSVERSIERMQNLGLQAFIVIPEGYGESVRNGTPATIDYYSPASGTESFSDPVLVSLQSAVQRVNASIVVSTVGTNAAQNFVVDGEAISLLRDEQHAESFAEELRQRAEDILAEEPVRVQYALTSTGTQEPATQAGTGFGQAVPGQGATFVMFTVLGGMALLNRERAQGTLQRLAVLPLRRSQILGGKILAYFVLGMIQFMIVFAIGVLTGLDFGNDPLALLLLMVSFVLATTALGFALATRLRTEGQVGGASLLLALTLAPLGGAWWPLEITPDFMQVIGHISPVAWVMDGFNELIFFGGGLGDVLLPTAVLFGYMLVFFVIGIFGFRYD